MKRIFLFVLDSCGIGAMPDAKAFGDIGVNTLKSCTTSDKLHIPNMIAAGLGNMDGIDYVLNAGDYLVLNPEDGHMPGICVGGPSPIRKAVIKVPVKK